MTLYIPACQHREKRIMSASEVWTYASRHSG